MFCWLHWKGYSSFLLLFICSNNYDKVNTHSQGWAALSETRSWPKVRCRAAQGLCCHALRWDECLACSGYAVWLQTSEKAVWVVGALLGKGVMLAAWGWRALGFCQPGDIIYWGMLLWFFLCCGESLQGISPDTGSGEAKKGSLGFVGTSTPGHGVFAFMNWTQMSRGQHTGRVEFYPEGLRLEWWVCANLLKINKAQGKVWHLGGGNPKYK